MESTLKRLRYFQLDVFTNKPLTGNPLAVVLDADDLHQEQMQAIAREMNLSETTFVQKPRDRRALCRVRIFTTVQELPLAGHPVIGTWWLLAELGVVPRMEGVTHVMQETGAGVLPVEIVAREGRVQRVVMEQTPAKFYPGRINPDRLAAALGIPKSAMGGNGLGPQFVSTGLKQLMVPVKSRAALKRVRMSPQKLLALLWPKGIMAYVFTLDIRGWADVRARGFAPSELIEDPATGSGAGALGSYLVEHGVFAPERTIHIEQGIEMGRPSRIEVVILRNPRGQLIPRVGGTAVRVMEGTITV
jgi:trans-2,3-dihydro-3-hydroxyanthranilate isomerase